MKWIVLLLVVAVAVACVVAARPPTSGGPDAAAASTAGGKLPAGYRDWRLISVAREEGVLDDVRAVLGNHITLKAYWGRNTPFSEGTIISRIAWEFLPSAENNKTFGKAQSFVAGRPKNGVQFMIKDSV